MADIVALMQELEATKAAARSGATEITFGGRTVKYGSQQQMAIAIHNIQMEILTAQGGKPVRNVVPRSLPHRGW